MNSHDPALLEQLSAWMDGALPPAEARFLERRLAHDAALRARWERWQLGSACLRGQAVALMPEGLAVRIAGAVAAEPVPRPGLAAAARWPWLATAAALALAVWLVPRMAAGPTHEALVQTDAAGSAALAAPAPAGIEQLMAANALDSERSLVPAGASGSSIRDLPLNVAGGQKPWPRSPLIGQAGAAPAGLLVRHGEMLPGDGAGGPARMGGVSEVSARAEAATDDHGEPAERR